MAVESESVYQLVHNVERIPNPKGWGVRHTQALLYFLCLTVALMMRAHMNVTLVAMTTADHEFDARKNITQTWTNENSSIKSNAPLNDKCLQIEGFELNETFRWSVYRTYNWTKSNQHMIIFAFFVGYTSMMVPMGLAAQRFGGKVTILIALVVNGVVSLFTPWMPLVGSWALVAGGRLIQGLTQAAMFPSVHTLLAHWAPLSERGRLSTYVYTGSQIGTVAGFQVAGQLAGRAAGWPTTMWICGALSLTAAALLAAFGAATPDKHPNISAEEKLYITGHNFVSFQKIRRTPWRHILTSSAVWGLFVAQAGSTVSYLFIFTQTPVYMSRVIGLDIKSNGLYSSLPYVAMYGTTLMFGWAADRLIARGVRVVTVRRLANTIGMAVSGVFLALFSTMRSPLMAELLLITCLALHSGIHVGFHINHIDLAPNFAGSMMSVGNMLAYVAGLTVPALVSTFVEDTSDQKQWQRVFLTMAALKIVANGVFVLLARGDVQPWNDLRRHSTTVIGKEENIPMANHEKKENNAAL